MIIRAVGSAEALWQGPGIVLSRPRRYLSCSTHVPMAEAYKSPMTSMERRNAAFVLGAWLLKQRCSVPKEGLNIHMHAEGLAQDLKP